MHWVTNNKFRDTKLSFHEVTTFFLAKCTLRSPLKQADHLRVCYKHTNMHIKIFRKSGSFNGSENNTGEHKPQTDAECEQISKQGPPVTAHFVLNIYVIIGGQSELS